MDPTDQFAAAIEGKSEFRDVNIRQVGEGGFILNGQRRWVEPVSGVMVVQQSFEGIAADAGSAVERVQAFLNNGSFAVAK